MVNIAPFHVETSTANRVRSEREREHVLIDIVLSLSRTDHTFRTPRAASSSIRSKAVTFRKAIATSFRVRWCALCEL